MLGVARRNSNPQTLTKFQHVHLGKVALSSISEGLLALHASSRRDMIVEQKHQKNERERERELWKI